ncbi:polyhydroxyalkanoate biosynthesis repressor PhaR [Iocasia frigidifontis]|uniref:Polyhydroxyalkanoate biosynthesis repressor PhaR n=1 Tax=Iocasia fonsfrigidae TaxID=2682810 RepID=A0A8A7KHV7_9FIRM|nr:N-acetylneuraminate synthase family protein [Iocasia fonsfrigidae]QTL97714.1 polyhydroxyalkanoate biosynthesis repressor PhaR [Iocasia fonsfrigidae]
MNKLRIGNRIIGDGYKPFIIAEIGINHEGDFSKAKTMIKDAYESGAECVKFQMHIIEDEMTKSAKNVIPGNADESIWEIMDRCSLTKEEHVKLKEYVEELGMIYLCTPFSRAAVDVLEEMKVLAYKIGSGECNNYPLIEHISSFGRPVILSTGMNNIESILKSVDILEKYGIEYSLLHCTSMYPTPYDKVRLGGIDDLRTNFPNAILGLSDHSLGNYTAFAAVALGAAIIEKHFTSNKAWSGPDVPISLNSKELYDLIIGCEAIYQAIGGKKEILQDEKPTIDFAYACVVAIDDIKEGEKLSKENIWVKRPGTGEIKAKDFNNLLGKQVNQDISRDIQLEWSMIKDD